MQRFFVPSCDIDGREIVIKGADARHISQSLRMKISEQLTACDGNRNDYLCRITDISKDNVRVEIIDVSENINEPPYRISLYQALPKGDKMDYIIQKAVELGVSEIIPFESERCIVRLDKESALKKQQRWQRIALEAAKQCGRGIIPCVRNKISFNEALSDAKSDGVVFVCYEGEGTIPLKNIISATSGDFRFFIGPEGGFSQGDLENIKRAEFPLAGLGNRILRTETASGFVLSCLSYQNEI